MHKLLTHYMYITRNHQLKILTDMDTLDKQNNYEYLLTHDATGKLGCLWFSYQHNSKREKKKKKYSTHDADRTIR